MNSTESSAEDLKKFQSKKLPQYAAAGVAALGAFGLGTVAGYTSTAIPDMKLQEEFMNLSNDSFSWVGSIAPIGCFVSGPVAGILVEGIGRKRAMLIIAPVFIMGWLLIGFASEIAMVYAGRFFTGLSGGTFSLIVPVYVAETAESSIRGTLGSSLQLMINCGVTFAYVVGYFVDFSILAFASTSIPILFFLLMFFMPESPRYLMQRKEKLKASQSLQWLRGAESHEQIQDELNMIQNNIDENEGISFRKYFTKPILHPICISLALMFFQQWNGNNAIIFYTVEIFKGAGSSLDPNIATIVVGAIQIVASIAASILMDKTGRRILLMISGALMTVSLAVLGGYFQMKEDSASGVADLGWLPLLCLIVFIVAFSLGFGPIAWLLAGEILPPSVRGTASALATSFNWLNTFVVTKVFDNIQIAIGIQWCFWIFGIASALGTIFVYFLVFETKGKTLDEIQSMFKPRRELDSK